MLLTVPNVLTWMRIFSIPIVVLLFYMPFPWSDPAAGALFALAGPLVLVRSSIRLPTS
jgi:phosphatidylglycerophosphate synthase